MPYNKLFQIMVWDPLGTDYFSWNVLLRHNAMQRNKMQSNAMEFVLSRIKISIFAAEKKKCYKKSGKNLIFQLTPLRPPTSIFAFFLHKKVYPNFSFTPKQALMVRHLNLKFLVHIVHIFFQNLFVLKKQPIRHCLEHVWCCQSISFWVLFLNTQLSLADLTNCRQMANNL